MIRILVVAIIIVVLVGSSLAAAVALVGLDEDLYFSWN
jgi:hypothetical protein